MLDISFDNKKEVMEYIHEKPRLFGFYSALPHLVKEAFGNKSTIHLSMFNDQSDLKIEIKAKSTLNDSNSTFNDPTNLTHKFFTLIDEHQPPFKIHQYVVFYMYSWTHGYK